MGFKHKDIIGLQDLTREEIQLLLDTADNMKEINSRDIKKVPTLRGKTVVNVFYEASTRTRTSFEIAAKRLSADTINISASTSSVTKGETLSDTARNILAMKPDIIVMRHAASGAHHYLAQRVSCSVINAGDGAHEHPSQGLLDMLTMRQKFGTIEGLTVAIVGDITHSRVARSDIFGLTKMGAHVRLAGPPTMMPPGIERLGNVTVCRDMREAIEGVDVVMMLRIQLERQGKTLLPTLREYARYYGLNPQNLKLAKPGAMVMHPGPINRGVELSSYVADSDQSAILTQVENGVAVRMAMLYHVSGGELATE
ncbi:aspartate carbamoyltransferase catalytic subunit [Geobacter sulfurreducens]|jgi:aspartate carbamoyltransferase catalytic subunit|uniref:Aspartate carbamoyltransferase catalytic subunit n=1 Tax=Geobacter sulfurreducens (strain ATCC 51573 / DSM 12127 / PCA) TaxID=243231 RepID=PYRB_GEOSL|nr:aspartate carbamoyltransferase catalytic subunit [Geobacter sulfurreducens]Q74DP5.1 RecName: Full=Aspartate carbamoyltransferase catalytic subunit; AltName: Full=Aspartate transcarbamylase; Short=ATCase [Geobacter sulfurreducens PCA]AAR34647.1 aspartate carbamyltransferase [Geobacter sulfurreducens PCA]ADI84106.1 aspartate carbamyltransferase [Geobacter sulfurreducens KN400]AJY70981.1 aspartate carbamoyltransferase [Geobacter sulfurreducens]QVW36486.1 aspartate carbamoyltransferase catalyti